MLEFEFRKASILSFKKDLLFSSDLPAMIKLKS